MDGIFTGALANGKLRPDPTLRLGGSGEVDPAIQRLIEIGRAVRERAAAEACRGQRPAPFRGSKAQPVTGAEPGEAEVQLHRRSISPLPMRAAFRRCAWRGARHCGGAQTSV